MSGKETFTADWLSLREPVDHAARSRALAKILDQHFNPRDQICVTDLGAGQGSNLRWLAPQLNPDQSWVLIDHDSELLARATTQTQKDPPAPKLTVEARELDLATADLEALTRCDLVTGSALLDLVSAAWLKSLVEACDTNRCAAFFALSVNGIWQMMDADGATISTDDDRFVQTAFNQHQLRDKGLGAALGPAAGPALAQAFAARSFRVDCRSSNWQLPAGHPWTQNLGPTLLAGWHQAAVEQTGEIDRIDGWLARRREELLAGCLGIEVGHLDCLAVPLE